MYFHLETQDSPFILSRTLGLDATPHLHTHLELVYILSGRSICCADDREQIAERGDIFLAFPNQIHYYRDIICPDRYLLIFSADLCPDLASILRTTTPGRSLIKEHELPAGTKELLDEMHRYGEQSSTYAIAARKALLTLLLCNLLPLMQVTKTRTEYDGNLLKKAVAYCYDNYRGEISLESAESALGTSRYYISHLFREKLHIGFKEYINSLRIQSACDMLRDGDRSITEIAYDAGFGTTRTFNRCFLESKGITPKEYRNLQLRSAEKKE